MSDDMLKMCKRYDALRSPVARGNEHFFVHGNGSSITDNQQWHLVRYLWAKANPGVPAHLLPRFRPYDLRHRYASAILQKWLDEGHDLYVMLPYLRAYMGHERFVDTAYYIHILPENLLKSPGIDWDRLDKTTPEVGLWKN
jgi:integrase